MIWLHHYDFHKMLTPHERVHLHKQEERQLRYNIGFKLFALRFFVGIGALKRLRGKAERPFLVDLIYTYCAAQSLVLSHVAGMRICYDGDVRAMSERVLAQQRKEEMENVNSKKKRLTVDQMFQRSALDDWK